MRKKEEILAKELGGYLKMREQDLPDRIHNSMQEYADEFACAFAEWIVESKYKLVCIKKGIIYSNEDMIKPESVIEFYTTTELLEIFKKEIK